MRSPPPSLPNKNWRVNSLNYKRGKPREEVMHRRRMLPHEDFAMEHSYRASQHSRSPPRLGDKFVERSRYPDYRGHESSHRHHPSHPPSRERRIICQVRRSPPFVENDRYSRGRMHSPLNSPIPRHRIKYSPSPQMRKRPRIHSLERSRRPIERSSLGREERYKRLPDTKQRSEQKDEYFAPRDEHHSSTRSTRVWNSYGGRAGVGTRRIGISGSDTDQDAKKRMEKNDFMIKRDRKESTEEAKK